jgi:hypothetical protein
LVIYEQVADDRTFLLAGVSIDVSAIERVRSPDERSEIRVGRTAAIGRPGFRADALIRATARDLLIHVVRTMVGGRLNVLERVLNPQYDTSAE